MSVQATRPTFPLILACALSLSFVGAASAQDAEPSSGVASLNVAVSPQQVQQIVSERLLQDGVTVGLQALHQELRLTPGQEQRWRDFILASNAKPVGPLLATLSNDDGTPLNLAQAGLALKREQVEVEARRVKAMARLYRSLNDEQRGVFDQGFAMIGSISVTTQPMLSRAAD